MIAESYGKNVFISVRNCKTLFQIHSAFLPTMSDSFCLISLPTFDVLSVLSEKAMAPHSSTLAWKIPWMEEPGRLQSMGSLRVGHD